MRFLLLAGAAGLGLLLTACPQALKDDFFKSENAGAGGVVSTGNGGAAGTGMGGVSLGGVGATTSLGGIGGSVASGGVGVSGSAGEAGAEIGGSGGLGATGGSTGTGGAATTGGAGGATSTGGSGGSGATGGTGGSPPVIDEPLPIVVYAADNEVSARRWQDGAFGPAVPWESVSGDVAYIETRRHPNNDYMVTVFSVQDGQDCTLNVRVHTGTEVTFGDDFAHDPDQPCDEVRSFDVVFTQISGQAVLFHGEDNTLYHRTISPTEVSEGDAASGTDTGIRWLRAVSDPESDDLAVAYTSYVSLALQPLRLRDFDGELSSYVTVADTVEYTSLAFDMAFHSGALVVVRGEPGLFGSSVRTRNTNGTWTTEVEVDDSPGGEVSFVDMATDPAGIAAMTVDTGAPTQRLGAFFFEGTALQTDEEADASLRIDEDDGQFPGGLAFLNGVAIIGVPNSYVGGTAVGWFSLDADGATANGATNPVPFAQQTRAANPWSMRLAPYGTLAPGVIMLFAEEDGLFATSLSSLDQGWSEPVLLDANVDGSALAPFDISRTR